MGISLQDALELGQGIERPFQCEVHDDSNASASVNVGKMVWYCFACGASGAVDSKKAPSIETLEAMLKPDEVCRVYPESYLELFRNNLGNWATRFPDWLRWTHDLGCDPMTGDATFPVHTPGGLLAGVGRRRENPEKGQRFKYPPRWSAARSLFHARTQGVSGILTLTEGAGDATAVSETGMPAAALYGSGLHQPQIDLIARQNPRLILLGLDMDEAGERGVAGAVEPLSGLCEVVRVEWSGDDPAAISPEQRREDLFRTAGASMYGSTHEVELGLDAAVALMKATHQEFQ